MKSVESSPSLVEVLDAIEELEQADVTHHRTKERIGVTIPGEMKMKNGRTIPIRLRDFSPAGIGFFHYGSIEMGDVTVKLAVNYYRVQMKWCVQVEDNLYRSGGTILSTYVPGKRTESPANPQE